MKKPAVSKADKMVAMKVDYLAFYMVVRMASRTVAEMAALLALE